MVVSLSSLAPKSSAPDCVLFLAFGNYLISHDISKFPCPQFLTCFSWKFSKIDLISFCFPFILQGKKLLKLFTYMAFQAGKIKLENSITF